MNLPPAVRQVDDVLGECRRLLAKGERIEKETNEALHATAAK